jgi:hypothetical protein
MACLAAQVLAFPRVGRGCLSKHETPLTRKYWQSVGKTLVEEFPVVRRTSSSAQRLLEGLIDLVGNNRIAKAEEVIARERFND